MGRKPKKKSIDELEREFEEILKRNRLAFERKYAKEINALLGLSREEIDRITPDLTDLEAYDRLITVVKEASRRNLSRALLRERILAVGKVAVAIAGRIPSLAKLLM